MWVANFAVGRGKDVGGVCAFLLFCLDKLVLCVKSAPFISAAKVVPATFCGSATVVLW